jgi:hypothetical protein
MLRIFLFGLAKRRKQPERYAPLARNKEANVSRINFITGELKGKLGEIVGSSWKGRAYTKVYAKPENPNTPKQIETRALFQNIAHIGGGIRTELEQYARPKPHHMTAYNHLIQINKPMFSKQGTKWDPLELIIMTGELTSVTITTAVFYSTALTAVVTWDGTVGEASDKAIIVIHDNESKRTVHATEVNRDAGTVTIDASKFANVSSYDDIYAYLAFYKINDDGSGSNSDTTALKVAKT